MSIKILPVIDANTNNHNTDCIPYSSNSIKLIHQISPFPADQRHIKDLPLQMVRTPSRYIWGKHHDNAFYQPNSADNLLDFYGAFHT